MIGAPTKRAADGRYAVQVRCDACTQPIHGEHYTDDEVCQGDDGPGFFLCGRKRCGARYEGLSVKERRALFTAGRAAGAKL